MLNVIPRFIQSQVIDRIRQGEIAATAIFIDISGFTPMAEKLYKHGKVGSEVLSSVLNDTFQPIISKIYSFGGFISSFPGDAISAIFPSKSPDEIEPLVRIIQSQFSDESRKTQFGDFFISARLGVSQGSVLWGIVGKARKKTFFFRGKAISNSAEATDSCSPGEAVFVDNPNIPLKPVSSKYFQDIPDSIPKFTDIRTRIASRFTHQKVLGINEITGEFREIVPIFISFREMNIFRELNEFASMVLNAAAGFGGYFNGLFFEDKGASALVLFGAPVTYENNVERALEFILSIREDTRWDIRAGMSKGIAYTGVIGSKLRCTYTAIGDVANTAARIMSKAQWNQILVSDDVLQDLEIEYQTISLPPLILKGKTQAVSVLELVGGRRGINRNPFSDKFVGRSGELEKAQLFCTSLLEEKRSGGILYIYGDPGMGKSRLLFELSKELSDSCRTITIKTDDVLRKSLNPFIGFLKKYFNQEDSQSHIDNKIDFEEVWENLIEDVLEIEDTKSSDNVVDALENLHSVIGAMLGFHWGGSFYETLDAMGRFENTLYAINELFIAFSLLRPTIILLEDLQWLDRDSGKAFEFLSRNMKNYPLIIMVSSRLNDDGSKPALSLEDAIPKHEIVLDVLSDESSLELIIDLLEYPPEKELSSFVMSRTEGNPFYIEQFCLYLIENGHIGFENGTSSLVRKDQEIPSGIKTVLIARLDRLPEELRELVQCASILGQEFDTLILSEMQDRKDISGLLTAGEKEIIWTSSPAGSLYTFRHPLLRDASYDMQLRGHLRKLHSKAAKAVLKLYPDDKDQYISLAHHYENAKMFKEAILYHELAANYARDNYRNYDAIEMYDKLNTFYSWTEDVFMTESCVIFKSVDAPGFEDIPVIESVLKYISILSNQAAVLQISGEWDRAENTRRTILELALRINDMPAIAEAQYQLGKQLSRKGTNDESLDLLTLSLSLFTNIGDQNGITKVLGSIGVVHWHKGNSDEAMKCYEEQLDISLSESNLKETSLAHANMGVLEFTRRNSDKAMEHFKKHLELAIESGDRREEAKALGNLGIAYSSEENYSMTMECLEKELTIERELGHKAGICLVYGNMGIVFVRKGNYEKAIDFYRRSLKLAEELGDKSTIAKTLWNIGHLYINTGQLEVAEEIFTRSISIDEILGNNSILTTHITKLGNLYKLLNRYEKAEECYDKSISLIDETEQKKEYFDSVFEKADLYYRQKRYEDAGKLNMKAHQLAEETGDNELLFSSSFLRNLIISEKDSDEAVRNLENMLASFSTDEQKAELHFELHRILHDDDNRKRALEKYWLLYESDPKYSYLERINLLKD